MLGIWIRQGSDLEEGQATELEASGGNSERGGGGSGGGRTLGWQRHAR